MSTISQVHPPFWIPVWLNRPSLLDADGMPGYRLRRLRTVLGWFATLALTTPVICLGIIPIWSKIDSKVCPNIIQCQDPCVVQADPDIAGIGVRVATYSQTICNILYLGFVSSADRTSTTYGSLILTSLATVITMVVFSFQTQLSLHHATIATSLLSITMLPTHVLESWRVRSPGIFLAQQLRLMLYFGIRLWIAFQMPCLGSEPQCNLCTRTSFLIFRGHITTPFSRSWILISVLVPGYFVLTTHIWTYGPWHTLSSVPALISSRRKQAWIAYIDTTQQTAKTHRLVDARRADARLASIRQWWFLTAWPMISLLYLFYMWYDDETTARAGIKDRRWRQAPTNAKTSSWAMRVYRDARLAILVPRCQRAMISLVLASVLIIDTERTVALNLTASSNKWGYGQIFAMVATIPCVGAVMALMARVGRVSRVRQMPKKGIKKQYTL